MSPHLKLILIYVKIFILFFKMGKRDVCVFLKFVWLFTLEVSK